MAVRVLVDRSAKPGLCAQMDDPTQLEKFMKMNSANKEIL